MYVQSFYVWILPLQDLTLDKEEVARDLQLKSEDAEKDSTVNDILENEQNKVALNFFFINDNP